MTQQNSLVKTMCLYWALVLVALLAMGPFLHAHYGASQLTGLHMAGVSFAAQAPLAVTSFSQDEEQESAAVVVETSFAREAGLDVQKKPHSQLLFTVFVVAALFQCILSLLSKPDTPRAAGLSFLAGLPPLTHAPPMFRF